jgi:thiol-disulfide isomerase/thioredoxin
MYLDGFRCVVYAALLLGSTAMVIAQTSTPTAPTTPTEAFLQLKSSYRDSLKRSARASDDISTEVLQQAGVEQRLLAKQYISILAGKKWSGRDSLALARLYLAANDSVSATALIQQQLQEYRGDDYWEACSILLAASIEQRQWERARSLAAQLMENANLSSEADLHIGNLIRKLKDEDIEQTVILAQKRFSILSQRLPKAIREEITIAERAEELGNLYIQAGQPGTAKKLFAEQLNSLRAAAHELSSSTREYDQLIEQINFIDRLLSAGQRRAELNGAAAPELVGEDFLDMSASDLANQRGMVVLLDFFAHSCAPCVVELEEIDRLREKYKGKLSAIVVTSYRGYFGQKEGISRSEEKAALKHLKREKRAKTGLLIGPVSNFNQYGIVTLPAFALIDAAGRVRTILISASIEELRVAIEKLIKEAAQRN